MDTNWMNRRLVLTSLCAIAIAAPGFAQQSDGVDTTHGSDKGKGKGRGGAQGGRPEDSHGGEDDHGDDHADDSGGDDHGDDSGHASGGDDHGDDSDHASGKKGKGPKYRGGRVAVGVSHGRSLEDRVLKTPSF